MTGSMEDEVILVEDDPIFAMLFGRAWKARYPEVSLTVATSLAALRARMVEASDRVLLVILDQNLPDGYGAEAALEFPAIPAHLWSALGDGDTSGKPRGKAELDLAVDQLGEMAGLWP